MQIERLAVLNRGAPAMRLIQAAREYAEERDRHIHTIALPTEAEREALFVREADEAVCIGPAVVDRDGQTVSGYLDLDAVGRALAACRADAAWVGWGPLARHPGMAELCERLGIASLGPTAETLRRLADDDALAGLAGDAGVPFAPWRAGPLDGLRQVEVLVLADDHGNVWSVGVHDGTLQRRTEKVLSESASAIVDLDRHEPLTEGARRLARACGFRGAGTVTYLVRPADGAVSLLRLNAGLPLGHPVTELCTGLDLAKLQLQIAEGGRLDGTPPPSKGHAIAVRLNAEDAEAGFAPTPGPVALLQLPTGPGLRIDAGVAEGDVLPREFDPTLAEVVAWGHHRDEARVRLRRALTQLPLVLYGGTTNKGFLLDLLDLHEVRSGAYDLTWLDRRAAAGATTPERHADLAVVMAAVDAYDTELALDEGRFLAWARRGRPRAREGIGYDIEFLHRGVRYAVHVDRTGRQHYRVLVGGAAVEVRVDRLAPFQSRLGREGETFRVVSAVQGADHLVEVEGVPHRLSRADGGLVRAPSPGVVVALRVTPGDTVEAGDAVAVLESMKMELAVPSPVPGRVRDLLVGTNVQVDAGTPLVRIDPPGGPEGGTPVAFTAAARSTPTEAGPRCVHDLHVLRRMVLGYDVDAGMGRAAADDLSATCATLPPGHTEVLDGELRLLGAYADLRALYRSQRERDEADLMVRSPQEHLHAFLRSPEAEGRGLPARYLTQLGRALAHYQVDSLAPSPALHDALYRIHQSQARVDDQVPVVVGVLQRWLDRGAPFADDARAPVRAVLDRLIGATQRSQPMVADLAREARFRLLEEPDLLTARRATHAAMAVHAEALVSSPPAEAAGHLDAIVDCPLPLVPMLLARLAAVEPAQHAALLEVVTRRYYRRPPLHDVETRPGTGGVVLHAVRDEPDGPLHVLAAATPASRLADAAAAAVELAGRVAGDQRVVVDLYTWADERAPAVSPSAVADALADGPRPEHLEHLVVAVADPAADDRISTVRHVTFRPTADGGLEEDRSLSGLHPMMASRLHLWRLANFAIERLAAPEDVYVYRAVARDNRRDERLFALAEVRDITPVRDEDGRIVGLPELERALADALDGIRRFQAPRPPERRLHWNRVLLYVWPPLELDTDEIEAVATKLAPSTLGLGLEEVAVHCRRPDPESGGHRERVLRLDNPAGAGFVITETAPPTEPLAPLDDYTQKVVQSRRRGAVYPYELLRMLTAPGAGGLPTVTGGSFQEHDLDDEGRLVPVDRPPGTNRAGIVVGVVTTTTARYPEGMRRVVLLGDPTRALGSLAEAECRRIMAGLDLAEAMGVPLEWFAISAGARIAMDSGTENMDWIADVLRRIIEFTQMGGEVNVVVTGINVGAQPYWNAEATMLMHTRGILVMMPESAMVLTGKQALDYSGSVSAEDNHGIGGYERIMGPNGQAQYWAPDLEGGIGILLRHYEHAYVAPGERFPRRAPTDDPLTRDVRPYPHRLEGSDLLSVGDIFSDTVNPGRKQPFDIRTVMAAVFDQDHPVLERWRDLRDADTAVVWDAHLGGWPVCAIGLEGHALARRGVLPADGPEQWTSGTLFPMSSKKVARAVNAASGNRPVVVLANLSGFDGSPESMRSLQLEFGAEIGRAVVNFAGPIVFCVVSRYHGGAFVVFSQKLNPALETIAVEGSHASVIGGAPAAAVVFAGEVRNRTRNDPRVAGLEARLAEADGSERAAVRAELERVRAAVHSEMLGQVAAEFDRIHSVERALAMGSVSQIIPAARLRPLLVEAVERGIERELGPPAEPHP